MGGNFPQVDGGKSKTVVVEYLLRISELVTQGKELKTAAAAVQKEMKNKQLHDKKKAEYRAREAALKRLLGVCPANKKT